MSQISVNSLTFAYEGSFDNIFENVSFSIDTDWKLGLIGRNGKGKTTFLRLLEGGLPYTGSIHAATAFDYFPYSISSEQMQRPAAEWLNEIKPMGELWRLQCELGQMQEDIEILYRPFCSLSPGERAKTLLAALFSGENDFLLIDEPTNHLDFKAREAVKQYLTQKKGFLLVSHDRDLLDACIDHVLALNRQTIEVQSGNFSSWWENKRRSDAFAKSENEKHLKEIDQLRQASARASQWADQNERSKIGYMPVKEHRFLGTRPYIGSKTKKMQRRVKQMQTRMEREITAKEGLLKDLEEPEDLKLAPLSHPKERLFDIREYSVSYSGASKPVFQNLSLSLRQGERLALHGANGCGKSTLMKLLLQKAGVPDVPLSVTEQGAFDAASGLVISYVSQDTSLLKGRIPEFCIERGLKEALFCAILRQLDFGRDQFLKDMRDFSDGQKKKALLAASLLTPAHLYVWDEPLNYVDVFSRMQLEKLLLSAKPTMLFVEHDARFQETVATRTAAL